MKLSSNASVTSKAHSTEQSQMITHPATNHLQQGLLSMNGRERLFVLSLSFELMQEFFSLDFIVLRSSHCPPRLALVFVGVVLVCS